MSPDVPDRAIPSDAIAPGELVFLLVRAQVTVGQLRVDQPGDGGVQGEDVIIERTALHARRIEFQHPITAEVMNCEAPLPEDFSAVLEVLRNT